VHRLTNTISIYSEDVGGSSTKYVEVHDINYLENNTPVLGTGRPLTKLEANDFFALFSGGVETTRHFLPDNVLLWHVDPMTKIYSCVFWVKSSLRKIHFQDIDPFYVPWPPMVFSVNPTKVRVFALKANRRPRQDTKMFHFPAWNRYELGNVCMGSGSMPKVAGPSEVVEAGLRFWFDTEFSHAGAGIYKNLDVPHFWKNLEGEKKYPSKTLKVTDLVLGDLK
jgi:PRTRC genetic system protein B